MRYEVLNRFESLIEKRLETIKTVAIVGGSRNEIELTALPEHLRSTAVVFGIDHECDFFLDLNVEISIENTFDLILCSQVLEHIWNIDQAFKTFSKLLSEKGFLWVACPASNRAHGSPEYFSAGYQPELLSKVAALFDLETISYGRLGSERSYFMTHGLSVWPSNREHLRPIRNYEFSRLPGPFWKDCLRFCRDFYGRLFAVLKSPTISDDVRFATESYALLQKVANSEKSDKREKKQ